MCVFKKKDEKKVLNLDNIYTVHIFVCCKEIFWFGNVAFLSILEGSIVWLPWLQN